MNHIRSAVEAIANNTALYEEKNFCSRVEAVDDIEFNVIDRIEGLLRTNHPPAELVALKQAAESVKRRLEAIDQALFQRLRADIRMGGCTGTTFKALVEDYVRPNGSGRRQQDGIGYDRLDLFINGLLLTQALPSETKLREPEMVYYQQTPARIIFELAEKAQLTGDDAFFDLGSGLGHVPILVNLLSGATAKGIEFEPAYCEYARACAADLNLPRVEFINADARAADYAAGTVFFMYTPFRGRILHDVVAKLQGEAQKRRIRLFTYGPCTTHVSQQSWLARADQHADHPYKLGVFSSR